MKVGFALPQVGPWASRDAIDSVATGAEQLGYDSVWTLDRLLKPLNQRSYYPPNDGPLNDEYSVVYDNLTMLSYVAALTSSVRLGVGVLDLPQYQPLLLAKRVATLDQLSGGRVTLGLGAGWSEDEFVATGTDFGHRGSLLDESLDVLRAAWGPDPVAFDGAHFQVPASQIAPKPVQQPRPPLLLGGFAPAALRRVARVADGYLVCCVPVEVAAALADNVRQLASDAGRAAGDLHYVAKLIVRLSDDDDLRPDRPMGMGSWEQVRRDVLELEQAGFDEIYFDVWLYSRDQPWDRLHSSMEQFRTLPD